MTPRDKWDAALTEVLSEYVQPHAHPWLVGFSGGKDSTLTLQLVLEAVLLLPPSKRLRAIHAIGNDTLVESVLYSEHFRGSVARIREGMAAHEVPFTVTTTVPDPDETFWVLLIGKGYPPPTRWFRWCTSRLKIDPATKLIKSEVARHGGAILVTGVRSSESAARAASIARHAGNGRLSEHGVKGCMVFKPISDFTTEEVWETLLQRRPPWGGTHRDLVTLYRNANGGEECPLVTDKADAPGCGTGSARFGCWVCTVVKKDRSLAGLVDAGYDNLEPLLDFRDWLKTFREDMSQRWKFKRDGSVRHTQSGSHIPGPFKLSVRRMILERLKETERDSGLSLISDREVARIQMLWLDDAMLLAQHGCTEDSWGWKHPHPPGTLAEPLPSSES